MRSAQHCRLASDRLIPALVKRTCLSSSGTPSGLASGP